MTEECVCGFEAENGAGLSAHQRHCDEYEEDAGAEDGSPTSVSTGAESPEEADLTEVEQAVFERDDGVCRVCDESAETVHRRFPSVDTAANMWAVCESCDDELDGVNPHSKKTVVSQGL